MKKLLFLLIIIGQYAFAQNKTIKDTISTLETVFVTANRTASLRKETPVALSKLPAKTIDETKAISLYEIINKTPGVNNGKSRKRATHDSDSTTYNYQFIFFIFRGWFANSSFGNFQS